jgi:transcriptional regulator GlxA family with amidase domain
VIVPSVLLRPGRLGEGALSRSGRLAACDARARGDALLGLLGVFLLAETGLFDGKDATVHFGYARAFATTYPAVTIHPERVLVISGLREELVSSGASMTWHDLVLYLIARHAGATAAQAVARLFALQWHQDGLTPRTSCSKASATMATAKSRARSNGSTTISRSPTPCEEMIKRSRLAERTFKRRFTDATGLTPLAYVQRLRIEDAKRRLERTDVSIDEISWQVGYEDPAFFRRLFKRTTGIPSRRAPTASASASPISLPIRPMLPPDFSSAAVPVTCGFGPWHPTQDSEPSLPSISGMPSALSSAPPCPA